MSELNTIYEALLNRNEKVCHKSEIEVVVKEYKRKFASTINSANVIKYLSRHNLITRIFQGYYYVNSVDEHKRKYCRYEDKELLFMVLRRLNLKWYVGLISADYINRKVWQLPAVLHIINTVFSGKRVVLGMSVIFHKVKERLIFAIHEKKTAQGVSFFYSDTIKTELDMLYFRRLKTLHKTQQMESYLIHYPRWLGQKLT